jgi:hypothetical protein
VFDVREPTLGTYPYSLIEVACRYCKRRGRYRREKLIRDFGGGMPIDTFVRLVSSDCRRAEDRAGRKPCNGPYVIPPEAPSPKVSRDCMLIKEKKVF